MVGHKFNVSPPTRCDSAANVICKGIDIFKKNYISITDILYYLQFDFILTFICPYSVGFILYIHKNTKNKK